MTSADGCYYRGVWVWAGLCVFDGRSHDGRWRGCRVANGACKAIGRGHGHGAGALIEVADEPPSVLRENVTSKGGTTAAALSVLMADDGLPSLMERAAQAAKKRLLSWALPGLLF